MKTNVFSGIFLAAFIACPGAGAESAPRIQVNGETINTEAVIINDRTYVPLRGVLEKTGAQVFWNEEMRTAIIETGADQDDDMIIPGIIENISPSVVGIIGRVKSGMQEGIAHGSGIVIKSGGEILTNAHVVKDMTTILVVTNDGKGYEAKLKYIDKEADLAVIKINKIGLKPAAFAAGEDIVVGKRVIAIGTPISFSLRNSATVGYISGVNRNDGGTYKMIQTDVTINPGNSGGALVNMRGEVIGVTSSGYLGLNTNFAIPVDTVKYVLNQFELYGKVKRAGLGAEFREDWLAELGIPSEAGLIIRSLESDSPLVQAGFKTGDTLVSINNVPVNSIVELNEKLKEYMPGDTIKAGISDGQKITYTDIVLAEKSEINN